MNTLITVGIPIYNAERFLADAIQSVINQSFQDWELLLTDDGSKDKSIEITKKFLSDSRIKLIVDGENKGLPFRLNQQVELAKGKYFARMDADDIMHPERFAQQIAFLEANPQVDVVGTAAYSINQNNDICGILNVNPLPKILKDVFNARCFIHPTIMGKRCWFQQNPYNLENRKPMEDYELWAKTILFSTFRNIETPLFYYRKVGTQTLKRYVDAQRGDRDEIRKTLSPFSVQRSVFLLKSHLKSIVYTLFCIFKQQDILVKRRSSFIDDIEKQNASDALNKVINQAPKNEQ